MEKINFVHCTSACSRRFRRNFNTRQHGNFSIAEQTGAFSSGMAVPGGMDDLIPPNGNCFLSCSDIRKTKSFCFNRLRDTACIQLFLVYYFLRFWGLLILFCLVSNPMDSDSGDNHPVFPNIRTSRIFTPSVFIMGYICRISQFVYLSAQLNRKNIVREF